MSSRVFSISFIFCIYTCCSSTFLYLRQISVAFLKHIKVPENFPWRKLVIKPVHRIQILKVPLSHHEFMRERFLARTLRKCARNRSYWIPLFSFSLVVTIVSLSSLMSLHPFSIPSLQQVEVETHYILLLWHIETFRFKSHGSDVKRLKHSKLWGNINIFSF